MRIARETLTLMGGVGREGQEWEAEVCGADVELELAQGLEEHGQLDVPDGPEGEGCGLCEFLFSYITMARLLLRRHNTRRKTIISQQASTNHQILCHEGV